MVAQTRKQSQAAYNKAIAAAKDGGDSAVKGAIKSGAQSYLTNKMSGKSKKHTVSSSSVGTKRRRSGAKYQTSGTFQGNFKKGSVYKPSNAMLFGASIDVEKGGVAESASCLYVGHAIMANQFVETVARSVIRRLFLQIRECPRTYEQHLKPHAITTVPAYDIHLTYVTSENGPVVTVVGTFQTTQNLADIGTWLNQQFFMSTGEEKSFRSIYVMAYDRVPSTVPAPIALLNLDDVYVHLSVSSKLSVQNRTLGGSSIDKARNADDVTNNPLEGSYLFRFRERN